MVVKQPMGSRISPSGVAPLVPFIDNSLAMIKLQQNQFWRMDEGYVCIVRLERLAVEYKLLKDLKRRDGSHHMVTKKEFTRMIKNGALLTQEEVTQGRF